jgi:tryptophanyl-tRNA synthetase
MNNKMSSKPKVLSCIQPTSNIHIGNYFGAVENWVKLQDSNQYDCIYGVVDLHAITMSFNPEQLRHQTFGMVIDLLSCGLDPKKSIVFIQSLIPEHTELCWILSCLCPYGELTRMTQFKEKSEQLHAEKLSATVDQKSFKFISCGLFTYPVLQAADILLYRPNYIPVGKDQTQHIELSRNIAQRFNFNFGELFPEPKALLTRTPKIMSLSAPEKKMSKSLGEKHFVGLFEDEKSIRIKIKSAVTDIGPLDDNEMSPGILNLFSILKASGEENTFHSLMKDYAVKSLKYSMLKDAVADSLVRLTSELRKRKEEILADKKNVIKSIYEMSDNAREIASKTLSEVREMVGLPERK